MDRREAIERVRDALGRNGIGHLREAYVKRGHLKHCGLLGETAIRAIETMEPVFLLGFEHGYAAALMDAFKIKIADLTVSRRARVERGT